VVGAGVAGRGPLPGFANVSDERLVRPDAVHLAGAGPGGSTFPGTELFGEGRVVTVTFRGERTEVVVHLDGGEIVVANLVTSAATFAVDDRVAVHVDPSGVVRF
jgi:ABC-type Fe3+/spermidine/putrescine transport system ATPase subunit